MKREIGSGWSAAVIVCGKCSKRIGGGFGDKGRQPLAKALRRHRGLKGRRATAGVVESKCLGVCPRGAVVALGGGAPGQWRLVRPGDDLDQLWQALTAPADQPGDDQA